MVQKQYAAQQLFWEISYSTYKNLFLTNLNETLLELLSILVFRYPITKAHRVQNYQNIFMENWYT